MARRRISNPASTTPCRNTPTTSFITCRTCATKSTCRTRRSSPKVAAGAGLKYLDVGGGLGIDYDGSQTDFESSVNYTLQEYANDVIYHVQNVCDEVDVPHPTIITESGRGCRPEVSGRRRRARHRLRWLADGFRIQRQLHLAGIRQRRHLSRAERVRRSRRAAPDDHHRKW